MTIRIPLTLLLLIVTSVNVFCSTGDILRMKPNPIANALGEGCIALVNNEASVLHSNPAAMFSIYSTKLSLYHSIFSEGMRFNSTTLAMPFKYGVFGISANYFDYGSFNGIDVNHNPVNIESSQDIIGILAYALPLRSSVSLREYGSLGMNIKFYDSKLHIYKAQSYVGDAGFMLKIPFMQTMYLGGVYRNFGSAVKYIEEVETLPESFDLGLGCSFGGFRQATIVADCSMPKTGSNTYSLGVELAASSLMRLRGGYKLQENAYNTGFRAGVGFKIGGYSIDYAFTPSAHFSPVHNIGFSIALGEVFKTSKSEEYFLKRHLESAIRSYNSGNFEKALAEFEGILSVYPNNKDSVSYLDRIKSRIETNKENKEKLILKLTSSANKAMNKKDYFTARNKYAKVLKIDKDNSAAKDGFKKAEDNINNIRNSALLKTKAKQISSIWKRANTEYGKGQLILARDLFKKILAVDSGHQPSKDRILRIDNELKKIESSQSNELFEKAQKYFTKAEYGEAIKCLEVVEYTSPNRTDVAALKNKCQEMLKEKEKEANRKKLEAQYSDEKKELEKLYQKAARNYDRENYKEAYEYLSSYQNIAQKIGFEDADKKVAAMFESAKRGAADKSYKEAYLSYQKNDFVDALMKYKEVLKYDPENSLAAGEVAKIKKQLADSFYEKGMKSYSDGDIEKAKELFKKSLEYMPNKTESLRALERIK